MVDKTKILTSFCPDHSCIELKLESRATGYWKFNASLTNDTEYINKLNELLDKWVAEYNYIDDKRVYWDLIKYETAKEIEDDKRWEWEQKNVDVMKYLLESKAEQCEEFRNCLLENKGKVLAETTMSMIWGTGLSPYVSTHTAPYYWPGKNMLGALLMDLTGKLFPGEDMNLDEQSTVQQSEEDDEEDEEEEDAYEDAQGEDNEEDVRDKGTCRDREMIPEETEHTEQMDHSNTDETDDIAPHSSAVSDKTRQTPAGSMKTVTSTFPSVKHSASGVTEKLHVSSPGRTKAALRKGSKSKSMGGNAVKKVGALSTTPGQQDIKTALTGKRKNPYGSPLDSKDAKQAQKQIRKDNSSVK